MSALLGLLCILLGAYLALRPFASLTLLVLVVVAALLLSGITSVVEGMRGGPRRALAVATGLQLVLAAVALLTWPGAGLGVISTVAALALVVLGVADVATASRGTDRLTRALLGAASVLVGVVALAWPDVALLVIAAALGVRLVVSGWRLLALGLRRTRSTSGYEDQAGATGGVPTPGSSPNRRASRTRFVGAVLALGGALVLVGISLALERGSPRPDAFYDGPPSVPDEPGRLVSSEPFSRQVPAGATAWRILYTTTRDEGVPALASGIVVVPEREPSTYSTPAQLPVIAWAHGTTGWAPGCAPSILDEPFESGALFVLDRVLAEGWALVMTDYVGLGTPSPHPYVIGQGEARSVLDSLRAARGLLGEELAQENVVWGHSQGGHAALWTGILAGTYAPELSFGGVAALAPASNLAAFVEVIDDMTGGSLFAAYVAQAYADVYADVSFDDYVRPGARRVLREMAQRCLSEPSLLVSVATSLFIGRQIWLEHPSAGPLAERLAENTPVGSIAAPLLLAQGEDDSLITQAAQDEYVMGLCELGVPVDYRSYAGRDHVGLVMPDSAAVAELFAWTRARFSGEAVATSTC